MANGTTMRGLSRCTYHPVSSSLYQSIKGQHTNFMFSHNDHTHLTGLLLWNYSRLGQERQKRTSEEKMTGTVQVFTGWMPLVSPNEQCQSTQTELNATTSTAKYHSLASTFLVP